MDQTRTDCELLADFAKRKDERAFAEFVRRRLDLVYSVTLRALNGDRHLAEDVSQQVFADAARKASQLSAHKNVTGWLFTSARYAACRLARSRSRQLKREQKAAIITDIDLNTDEARPSEPELQPMLDDAIARLPAKDQSAILLRFYAQLDYASIGARLDLTANAARMRVDRALRKLEAILAKRKVTSTAIAISAGLESHALVSAPTGLSASVSASVLSSTAATSLAGAAVASGVKWPLVATLAIAAMGTYLQSNLPERPDRPTPEAEVADASPADPAPPRQTGDEFSDEAPAAYPGEEDPVERAYAALDSDTALLSARLEQINEQLARNLGKAPEGARLYEIRDLDKPPRSRSSKAPTYPAGLHGAETAGEVVVEFTIDEQGALLDPKILGASHPEFAKSVLETLPDWRFAPGEIANAAVASRVKQVIKFKPSKDEPDYDWWF